MSADRSQVIPYEDVDLLDETICRIPSCRWRGTDHPGRCKEIDGELEMGPDRGQRL